MGVSAEPGSAAPKEKIVPGIFGKASGSNGKRNPLYGKGGISESRIPGSNTAHIVRENKLPVLL